MAGGANNDRGGMIVGINVTPLVDITLVLLIIFIVTAKLIVNPAVPLDLPKASTGQEVQVVLSIAIPASGPAMANGVPVETDAALRDQARTMLASAPDLRAVINADGAVAHRRVVHMLDLLRDVGISKVAFGAVPDDGTVTTP